MFNRRLLVDSGGDTETVPTGSIIIKRGFGSVTIPQGVNVVLVEMYWDLNERPTETSRVGVTAGKTYNLSSLWLEYNYGDGQLYNVYNTVNEKNWLYAKFGTDGDETGYEQVPLKISWSPTINEQSPHWTDY